MTDLNIFNATENVSVNLRHEVNAGRLQRTKKDGTARKEPAPRNLTFIGLKVRADLKEAIEDAAAESGLMFSEYLRQLILSGLEAHGKKFTPKRPAD